MQRRTAVKKGQRYTQKCQTGYREKVWEVASFAADATRVQHARMFNIGIPSETKTLSCFALGGGYGFNLVKP